MGVEGDDVRIAVTEAIDECIDEDILVDFFEQHREEVVEVSIYDYDEEDVRRTLFEEAKEMAKEELKETVIEELKREAKEELTQEVFAEGEQSGEQLKIVNQIIKKVKKSKTTGDNSLRTRGRRGRYKANIRSSSFICPRL
ncbi:hypothetical protein LEA_00276 [human gut metagenome]|uniref:Uncharacterized protein n=1 Tax=human gut metagenome TaxID=408170 RepID=K1VBZ6_9ZZZZ